MAKAIVFPEPVLAFPIQSLPANNEYMYKSMKVGFQPASMGGIQPTCTSVGVVIDMDFMAACRGVDTPKDVQECATGVELGMDTSRSFFLSAEVNRS